jgi:phage shock protein C
MFCTKCGVDLKATDRFCSQCGWAAPGVNPGATPMLRPPERLSRPVYDAKIAGVCAGFARYFAMDVTVVRVLWIIMSVWPLPSMGVIAYIVAWMVMPKDSLALSAPQNVVRTT